MSLIYIFLFVYLFIFLFLFLFFFVCFDPVAFSLLLAVRSVPWPGSFLFARQKPSATTSSEVSHNLAQYYIIQIDIYICVCTITIKKGGGEEEEEVGFS